MPAKSVEKAELQDLLERLAGEPGWIEALHLVAGLPVPRYEDGQWQGLLALVQVLKLAVAELQIQFRDAGEVDFSEVSLRAGLALGELASPTALALRLDYRLRHILVDEFQDTSHAQGNLLEHLVTGWEPGDGRTLFVVGDPMQSIYRFREADVGLFLRVRDRGVGVVQPEYRVLECNFRSGPDLVDWNNVAFAKVFPSADDMHSGAVSYSPAAAASPQSGPSVVTLNVFASSEQEAERAAEIAAAAVEELDAIDETDVALADRKKIAILVRGKAHLAHILPALRRKKVEYQGVELESLANRQVVLDILSLAQAVSRLDHRPAWLAILRAPWCGLTLADLKALVGTDYDVPIWFRVMDKSACAELSKDGRERLARMRTILGETMQNRHRVSITQNVEWTWRQLGGPDCIAGSDIDDAKSCFALLAENEQGGALEDLETVEELLVELYAAPGSHDARVQVMTVHKAKGLEFDTVILPGLHRQPGSDDKSALMWAEVTTDDTADRGLDRELLLAPLPETGSEATAQYQFLRELERTRNEYEQTRLLYVACTRAQRNLHLLGVLKQDKDGDVRMPHSQSLLMRLWPAVADGFVRQYLEGGPRPHDETLQEASTPIPSISRLPSGYSSADIEALDWTPTVLPAPSGDRPEFMWAGDAARLVGIWVHELLNSDYTRRFDVLIDDSFRHRCRGQFAVLGIEKNDLDGAVNRACEAVTNMQDDPRVEWLFSPGSRPLEPSSISAMQSMDG